MFGSDLDVDSTASLAFGRSSDLHRDGAMCTFRPGQQSTALETRHARTSVRSTATRPYRRGMHRPVDGDAVLPVVRLAVDAEYK